MSRDFVTNIFVREEEIIKMLSDIPEGDWRASSDFFARFGIANQIYSGRYFEALDLGEKVLHLCHRLNKNKYARIHKGLPYYLMGMAAYRIHDFTSAIFYIDAAVSEDQENDSDNDNTPAKLFLRLEGESNAQAAKKSVQHAQGRIEERITLYNEILESLKSKSPRLTMADIRKYLLKPATSSPQPNLRSLASTFITLFLEFDYLDFQLMLRPKPGTNEPFFSHLFKGCLFFETILKENPKIKVKGNTLEDVLESLSGELGLTENPKIGAANLKDVLRDSDKIDDSINSAIIITGKLRNTLGHNLGWSDQLTYKQYLECFTSIALSYLHAISVLYRIEEKV